MDIQHSRSATDGYFFTEADNKEVAKMVYSLQSKDIMVIEHTEVDKSLQGKNVGHQLLNAAVAFAKENSLLIRPVCSFVRKVFEKHAAEYADIIYRS